jgi:hypothetical protein
VLDEARRGTLPGMVRTGATLPDAAAEWLRYREHERAVKASTLTEYRHLADRIIRSLGDVAIEDVTPECSSAGRGRSHARTGRRRST